MLHTHTRLAFLPMQRGWLVATGVEPRAPSTLFGRAGNSTSIRVKPLLTACGTAPLRSAEAGCAQSKRKVLNWCSPQLLTL